MRNDGSETVFLLTKFKGSIFDAGRKRIAYNDERPKIDPALS